MRSLAIESHCWRTVDSDFDDDLYHVQADFVLSDIRNKSTDTVHTRKTCLQSDFKEPFFSLSDVWDGVEVRLECWWRDHHWYPTFKVGDRVWLPPLYGCHYPATISHIDGSRAEVYFEDTDYGLEVGLMGCRPYSYGKQD